MLIQLTVLNEDGTRNDRYQSVTVDEAELPPGFVFPTSSGGEREANRLALFRDAQRLFEDDPALLVRMQELVPSVPSPSQQYVPRPGRDPVFEALVAAQEALFPSGDPCDARVRRLLWAPQQRTLSFQGWVDFTIWHLKPADALGVYRNGQPFGDPLVEIWRSENEAPWDGEEEDHERR